MYFREDNRGRAKKCHGGPSFALTYVERLSSEGDMTVKLNKASFARAKKLVNGNHVVRDRRDAWSEDKPSAQKENKFIERHGFHEYAKWHLGIDDDEPDKTKKKYGFPYGDFVDVHRCAVLSAESRAGQYKHYDIERAAAHLLRMIDAKKAKSAHM